MAAAAYASLMSLMHTLEMILHPSQQLCVNRMQIESLLQKVCSLQEFLEGYSHREHGEMAAFGSRIVDMTRAADDVIDYHVLNQILARLNGREAQSSTGFSEYIQNLIKEMEDLIGTEVMRIKETMGALEEAWPLEDFSPAASSRLASRDHNTLVGCDEKLIEIMDTLTGQQSSREIIAIVGMGGIGKTNLAKNVYKNAYTSQYFHIRAWATVSQNYSARQIILDMLSEIDRRKQESDDDQLHERLSKRKKESDLSEYELGDRLYKILFDRRYLIVVDDLWSIEAWDKIRVFLPDNGNGSRIMITTRELNVARQLDSFMSFEMELLDDDQCWKLLRDKVFGKEGCPPELEDLGMDIAKKCRGLPLAIVAIGGLLAKSNKTREVWENTMENLNSIISSGDEGNCMEILKLSYKNLPIHLKPCFLYIAVISKCRQDILPDLAWSLVGEGFLKPIRDKSLEEVANEYITDLIDRNLVFVREFGRIGELKVHGMHDFLGDLCLKQAREENFLSVVDGRNLGVAITRPLDILRQASEIRSTTRVYASRLIVWNGLEVDGEFSPVGEETTQLPYLRLSFLDSQNLNHMRKRFIDAIPIFWCLQSLIVFSSPDNLIILPSEIWDLPQLRHIFSNMVFLCDPLPPHYRNDGREPHILENLHTLVGVLGFRCGEEVYKRAPNIKMLKIVHDPRFPPQLGDASLHNLVHLHKLETLRFQSMCPISLDHLSFPLSLKKLTLIGCHLPCKDMTIVGSLPNLEALGLHKCTFEGQMWSLVDVEFLRLKKLGITGSELLHWKADKTHFPILDHLVLRNLNLEEFPEDFEDHQTLGTIEVDSCSDSTNDWAENVREVQEGFGNEDLQVIIIRKSER